MSYTPDDFPLPVVIQNFPQKANLSQFDLNFDTISSHLANVANLAGTGGSGGAMITVSDTPPTTGLANGTLWWDSDHGTLKIYYEDADSNQWIDASRTGGIGGGALNQSITTYINNTISSASATWITTVISSVQGASVTQVNQLQASYDTLQSTVQGVQQSIQSRATYTELNQALVDASQAITTGYQEYVAQYVVGVATQGTIDLSAYATIQQLNQTVASAQGAIATQIDTLTTSYSTLQTTVQGVQQSIQSRATYTELNQAIASAQGAITTGYQEYVAQYVVGVVTQGTVDLSAYATVQQLNQTVVSAQSALATRIDTLTSQFTTLQQTVQGVQALVSTKATISEVDSAISSAQSAITTGYKAYVAQYVAQTPSGVDLSSYATTSYVSSAISGAGYASASTLSSVQSIVSGQQTTVSALSSSINGIQGRYGVTIDNNGAISGYELLSGTSGSDFIISADHFKVNRPGSTPFTVFSIDTGTNQLIFNGTVTVAAPTTSQVNTAINGGVTSGSRIELDAINGGRIKIYDSSGVLRVQLGYLG